MELNELESLLRQGSIANAVEVARAWARNAASGDIELNLGLVSESMRPKVAALLRDVITRYPYTVQGCPMMMYAEPESEHQRALSIELPTPSEELLQPCEGLRFLRWVSAESPIPLLAENQAGESAPARMPLMRMVCKVALFECFVEDHETADLQISGMWWARILSEVDAHLHVSSGMLMPYPDAIEAGRCAQASAQGRGVPKKGNFQTDTAWSWAWNEGVLFKESCRSAFPHANLP